MSYRDSFKRLPKDIYERLRSELFRYQAQLSYIEPLTQDLLLFNFDTHMFNAGNIKSDEAYEFYQATVSDPNNIHIKTMKAVSDRLLGAISNLKLKYRRYEMDTGIPGISSDELAEIYQNGLQAPFF